MKIKRVIFVLVAVACVFVAGSALATTVNPFMDVPMNHWSYDAITQLSARGVLSGFPDGTYKGNQPMTRYEAASALARSLAVVDMTKASKQDVEMLKRLVVEFKEELDLLGVKVSEIDSRVAVLENNLGGWKFWGEFRMDGKFANEDAGLYAKAGKSDFDINRVRIWLQKKVDDKVTFTTRFGMKTELDILTGEQRDDFLMDLAWLDIAMPWEIAMKVGKWQVDWSAADGTYTDNDSMFSDRIMKGFYFHRPWSQGEMAAYVSREDSVLPGSPDETLEYGARAKVNVTEDIFASANYMKRQYDGNTPNAELDESVLWGTLGAKFVPGVEGRFSYYSQNFDANVSKVGFATDDSAKAWHMSIAVDQSKLKFTSVRAEYIKPDENFRAWTDGPFDAFGAKVTGKELGRYDNVLFLRAEQKWNDKWTTFERYVKGSARWNTLPGGVLTDDTTNWSVGVRHWYTPSLSFELAYDKIDNSETVRDNSDHMVRFRTHVTF